MNELYAKEFTQKINDKLITFKELSAIDCYNFSQKIKDFKLTILDKDVTNYLTESAPKIIGDNFEGIRELIYLSAKKSITIEEINEMPGEAFTTLGVECLLINTSFFLTAMRKNQEKIIKVLAQANQQGGEKSL